MRYSSSAARSCSLMPGLTRATVCSKAREFVSTLRRISASSAGRFHHAQFFDPIPHRLQRRPHRQARFQRFVEIARHARRFVADALHAELLNRRQHAHHQRPFDDAHLAGRFLRRLNLVSRIGEQDALPGQHQQRSVAAREAGKVAQIGAEGDQQGVQLALAQPVGDGPAPCFEFAICHSAGPAPESERAPPAHPPGACRCASRPHRKAPGSSDIAVTSFCCAWRQPALAHCVQNLVDLLAVAPAI